MDGQARETASRRYRSKSQRPCDFCRRRRAACRIRSSPPCVLCEVYGRACTFVDAPPPRRRNAALPSEGDRGAPGAHTSIELVVSPTASSSEACIDIGSEGVTDERLSDNNLGAAWFRDGLDMDSLLVTDGDVEAGYGPLAFEGLEELEAGSTTKDAALLDPEAALAQMTTSPDVGCDVQRGLLSSSNSIVGPTDPMDPYLMRQYKFDSNNSVPFKRMIVRSVAHGHNPVQFIVSRLDPSSDPAALPCEPDNPPAGRWEQIDAIVARDVGERLLQLYFIFVFPQSPVVSAASVEPGSRLAPEILAAVYLTSLEFATFDDVLCVQTVYEHPPRRELKEFVWRSLNEHRNRPTLSSLQSALLLAIVPADDVLMPENGEKVALAGLIAGMANALGLQHDPSSWDLPESEKILRRRLSCLVKSNDTWIAAATGRPGFISAENWMVHSADDGEVCANEAERKTLANFVHFTKLSLVLCSILSELYSLRATAKLSVDFKRTLEITKPIMENIQDWYRGVPHWKGINEEASITVNHSSLLQLSYHAVRALLFRAILRPFHNADYRDATEHDDNQIFDTAQEQVRIGAKACAAAFTNYILGLDARDFQAFWPFLCPSLQHLTNGILDEGSIAAFALQPQLWQMLFLSSMSEQEAQEMKAALVQSRHVMRLQAKSFEPLRLGLLRIDSVWWRGMRKTVHLAPHVEKCLP